jgi:hypothetical protein
MIVGVAAKVVPVLRGFHPRELTGLSVPFVLINLGCALRVVAQTATDWADWVFPLAGASGVLEVIGLAVWGMHLARLMLGRPGWAGEPAALMVRAVRTDDTVADVLERHPDLLPVFLEFGFRPLASPILRRTAASGVTIDLACRILQVDRAKFLRALNARLAVNRTIELPVLDAEAR